MIRLVKPHIIDTDKEAINRYLKKIMDNENIDPISNFQNNFSKYIGVKYCNAVNSGSSALHLALLSLKVGSGDEVICSTHTCVAILNAISYVGAVPNLVDIKYDVINMNFNIDADKIANEINDKTKAIIVPHMFGVPANIEKIKRYNIPIIEDGTLSLGAKFSNGELVGSAGDVSIFSLHKSKVISADVGGVILTNNERYKTEIDSLLSYGNVGKYTVNYNYTMGELNAVLVNEQLKRIDELIKMRKENADKITKILIKNKNISLPDISNNHIYFRYLVEIPENITAEQVVKKGYEYEIEFGRGVYPALHNYLGLDKKIYTNSEKAQKRIVSIPVYPGLKEKEIEVMCKALLNIIS
ncbi:MAG: DegT/DnrJ/EryC1/StrS family aminotransferase [Bacillota bacterium]|nr:DegT/DnrJ/EryC1/StrS family aminotransferase [Bacillota bacterium]